MNILRRIPTTFAASLLSYCSCWSYFSVSLDHDRPRSPNAHRPKTCREFYDLLALGVMRRGDRVTWESVFLTEWIPRVPGGIAHFMNDGRWPDTLVFDLAKTRDTTRSYSFLADDYLPPLGSLRLPAEVDGKAIPLGGVTESEYLTDLGVVFCVSPHVYSEYLANQHAGNAVNAVIESYLDFLAPSASEALAPSGASQEPIPCLRVASPVQVSFRTHSSHPRVHAWTIRRVQNRQSVVRVKQNPDEFDRVAAALLRGEEVDFGGADRFTFVHVPKDTVDYDFLSVPMAAADEADWRVTRELLSSCPTGLGACGGDSGLQLLHAMRRNPAYRHILDADVTCLCDCDGKRPLPHAGIPIMIDPRSDLNATRIAGDAIREMAAMNMRRVGYRPS